MPEVCQSKWSDVMQITNVILYILYNSDLLDISNEEKQLGLGFIDDIPYGTQTKRPQQM
jgi:hypothetical protein